MFARASPICGDSSSHLFLMRKKKTHDGCDATCLPLANTVHLSPPASSPHHNCRLSGYVDPFVRDK